MKKGIVTILAIAIIGALGVYGKNHSGSAQSTPGTAANSAQPSALNNTKSSASSSALKTGFKDGTYNGNGEDTAYGTVQIAVVISGGQITDIKFLQMPNDLPHSQEVTSIAGPLLKQETLQKQNAHLDFVSGATSTSEGYQQSLQSALDQAA